MFFSRVIIPSAPLLGPKLEVRKKMNAKAFLCRLRKTAIPLLILAGCASLLAGAAAERTLRYVSGGGNSIIADFTQNSSSSFNPFALDATISTDKADYAPGEIVQISGGGFLPGETVQLQVVHIEKTTTSVTSLADHQGHDPWFVGADASGNVSSSWLVQEDSLNQTLLLTADGLSSGLHAEAIFTDAPAKITLEQCHNFDGALVDCTDAAGPTNYWGSGNAQQNNARLAEGDNQNFRAIMSGIAAGNQTLVIELDLTKGGKVAYDRYSSPARIRTATHSTGTQKAGPGATPESLGIFPCIDNGDVDAFCTPGTGVPVQIPLIPAGIIPAGNFDVDVRNSQNGDIPEYMFIYGDATLDLASATYSFSGIIDGDSSLRLSIPFTKTVGTGDLVLAWGGHVSKSEDYETSGKTTAVTIEGSPYHMRLISFTGIQGDTGNQDMQMASTAIAAPVGTITIIKDAVPNDAQDFAFTADNGLTPASFSLDDDGDATLPSQIDFTDVAIGTYNIAETLGTPDWVLTGLNCVDPNGGTTFSTITGIATIDISEGETVVCTFTNTKQTAELEVTKTPDNTEVCEGSTVTYTYVVTNTGTAELTNVNLDDDILGDIDGGSGITLAPGASQQFTKDGVINGVVHNTVTATGDTAGGQNAQATADATVTGVVCTISVTKVPRQTEVCNGTSVTYDITVTNNSPTFAWTGDVVDDILGTLEAGVTIPAAGSKSYTPSGSINGEVTNTVTADGAFDDPASSSASANANATVTGFICTISLTKTPSAENVCNGATVTYEYVATNNSPQFTWTGNLNDDQLGTISDPLVLAPGASQTFNANSPIVGTVVNTATATGTFDDGSGSSANASATATVNGSTCRIRVLKVTDPLGSPEEFAFTGDLSGSLKDGDPALSADVLAPGTYSTSETVPAGWDLTSISCNDANSTGSATPKAPGETGTATYQLELGETVTCTFTNTERGTVSITKTLLGGPIPFGESFSFQLRQGASTLSDGTVLDTKVVDSTTVFPLQLNGSLVPGDYQVCEFILPGWDSTIRTMTGAFVPNSLSDPANTDNAYVCAPITIDPGEDESISIDNSPPPGGMAKTIGFWKNWTSCDGKGNQDPILDETLALFPENSDTGTHGVFIGLLFVDTCEEAVTVLDKRVLAPINSKGRTKFANNSAVSMAAQLLAARLNIRAGADPSCIVPVIDLAQAYLEAVNYDGTGTDNISKVNAERINFLAGLLDEYNNNVLSCPLPSLPPAP